MRKLEVGQLFEEGKTKYNEGTRFDFQQSGPILYLFFSRPSERETEWIRAGKFELGFTEKDEIIFMLFKFGGMNYVDAPYSVHLSKEFTFDELQEGMGFGLNVNLIDASTGILKVIRYVGLSTDFSRRFMKAVERQRKIDFDKTKYFAAIQQIYGNYSTDDLVQRADAWCKIK